MFPDASPDARSAALVENHRSFLRFVERRVGDRETAEDILQDAFVKSLDRMPEGAHDESAVVWFYRVLRNAVIDHYRRQAAGKRASEKLAHEMEGAQAPDGELREEICRCVLRLATTLRPEYAEALRAIDVGGQPVKEFAASRGLTAANAGVRVFRAREALRRRVTESCGTCAEHGCLDCSCGKRPRGESQPLPPDHSR
jgi:RNA polymerase sigma factor (sigma-70 family)